MNYGHHAIFLLRFNYFLVEHLIETNSGEMSLESTDSMPVAHKGTHVVPRHVVGRRLKFRYFLLGTKLKRQIHVKDVDVIS